MEQRISVITLGVGDLERSRRFYEALGWQGTSPAPGIVFFQVGGIVLGLWSRDELRHDSAIPDDADRGGWGGVTIAHNVRSPEEVDRLLAQAVEAGATIGRTGARTDWGGYTAIFLDPDGHPWELAHNPLWPLDDDGNVHLSG